jgi:hypothetical protein
LRYVVARYVVAACVLFTVPSVAPAADAAGAWNAVLSPAGSVHLTCAGRDVGSLECGLFEEGWRSASMGAGKAGAVKPADGVMRSQIRAPGGCVVDTQLQAKAEASGLLLNYRLTPRESVKLNSLHVSLVIPASLAAGGFFLADGAQSAFPPALKDIMLRSGPMKELVLVLADGAKLQFRFASPTQVLVQDDRQWGQNFSVRIGPQLNASKAWAAGQPLELSFSLSAPGGIAAEYDEPITITAGKDWVPLNTELDIEAGSALDWSALVPWHTPAGKLGRVLAGKGGKMVFADQPENAAKFYGFNLCFSAQYLAHEQSDRLAMRLRRLGYNAVRFHHYESLLVDRSDGTSTRLNPQRIDELDYLFHALKQQGIYVTTDLFVSRQVFAREVWPGESGNVEMDEFKMAVPVNERAFENYRQFAKALLDHVNPYTKLRWGDDPALAWLSLINEPNPGNFIGRMKPRLKADYEKAWGVWLAKHHPDAGSLAMPTDDRKPESWLLMNLFLADNQREFLARGTKMLREDLHCRALVTNLNAWTNPVQIEAVRPEMDYVDDHFYVDHPEFIERPWQLPSRCANRSPVAQGAPGGRGCAFIRLLDKPFTCSEFNYSGPGRFRGVGGILTGALGAVQDWSVIWRFAYSHARENEFTPAAAGYFDMATDPLSQAADRASICLFRRGDMRAATHSVAVACTRDDALKSPRTVRSITPPWTQLAWITRVGSLVVDQPSQAAADIVLPIGWATPGQAYGAKALGVDPYSEQAGDRIVATMRERGWLGSNNQTDLKKSRLQSETGELFIDAPADVLTIDTPCTAGGYAPAGGSVHTAAVDLKILDTGATVWVSSIDGLPIGQSKRLLITHLTDLQNTDAKYADRGRTILTSWGKMPHLMRTGQASVELRIANPEKARVWSLATSGRRIAEFQKDVAQGALVLKLDVNDGGKARMLYEVELQ